MIEQAFISGEIGKAIYRQDNRYYLIDLESKDRAKECRPGDIGLLIDTGAEFTAISDKEIGIDEISALLEFSCKNQDALSLIICGLDGELSNQTRLLSLEAAEELLQDDSVRDFVRNRILARILPMVADPDGAVDISAKANLGIVNSLYREVVESRSATRALLETWEEVGLEFFPLEEDRARAEKVLIDVGFFADTVNVLNSGDINRLNLVVLGYGVKSQLKKEMVQGIHVLNAIRSRLLGRYVTEKRNEPYSDTPEPEQIELETTDPIVELIKGFEKKRESWQRKPLGAEAALSKVNKQIQVIKNLIGRGNIHKADEFLRDLIAFNLEHGEKKHVGMTLCSLAKAALDVQQFEMAERLIQYASMLEVDDAVIPCTRAEVFKSTHRLDEALSIYEETIKRFPNNAVPYNGRAEVLKGMGRLPDALAAYDESIDRFPNNAVPFSGRAEVLKEMGRLSDALAAYDESIGRFPTNVFSYTGRAEVLKEMGRLPDALAAYDDAILRFSNNAVSFSGRAEVLKGMGRLPDALAAYDDAILRFPNDVFSYTGRAEALKGMGRLPDALAAYDESIDRFPNDAVPYNGRAEVLKEMGRLPDALAAYDENIERFPTNAFSYTGLAEVLKEMGRLPDALAAYDDAILRFPNDVFSYTGRAEALKGMGRLPDALAAYDESIDRFPNNAVPFSGRAEVLKEMGRLPDALAAYDENIERFPTNAFSYTGLAEVLKEMGRLPDALAAYDESIGRFPNDAVPYNGRAEVLKQMEHFEEALAAYNQAIIRFPYNAVSRNGRAGVLILMGKHEEAASLLPHANLLSKSSWINYHISAMARMKAGDIDEAIKRLEYGLQNVPWVRFKNFFATALAVAKIKKEAFGEAVEILQNNVVYVDIFERQKHLLLISHSQAELGNEEDAANALAAVEYLQNPHIARLRDAISHHYRLGRITPRLAPKVEIPSPENDIDKEEFFLAVAA